MSSVGTIITKIEKVKDGFKPIVAEAEAYLKTHSQKENLELARTLYASSIYQARMMATHILGRYAATDSESLHFLRNVVSKDPDWRTQEMLAKAIDHYCKDTGYEKALPVIKEWLKDKNYNVRRAVSEGLRIWTTRDYFKQNPAIAINLLSDLKDDEHEYVRKSVGNALRDISKYHKDLIKEELAQWDTSNKNIAYTYSLANKFLMPIPTSLGKRAATRE